MPPSVESNRKSPCGLASPESWTGPKTELDALMMLLALRVMLEEDRFPVLLQIWSLMGTVAPLFTALLGS